MNKNNICGICERQKEQKDLYKVKILVNNNQWINDMVCSKCLDALNRHLKRFLKDKETQR